MVNRHKKSALPTSDKDTKHKEEYSMNLVSIAICWTLGFAFALTLWRDKRTPRQILHDTACGVWSVLSELFYAGRTLTSYQVLLIVILQTLTLIGLFVAFYSKTGVLPW